MSGIAGIVNLDGAPVDQHLLDRMMEKIVYRGPDAQETWKKDRAGLVHTLLQTTPESMTEKQPCSLDGRIWITADARIDRIEDLKKSLKGKVTYPIDGLTDPELILTAYTAWGKDCVDHLSGDFSFAVWDSEKKELFCTRDHLGIKQFYYMVSQNSFIFSTDISAVIAAMPAPPVINEGLIINYLANRYDSWYYETVYRDIFKLKPGNRVVVREEAELSQYADFMNIPKISYKSNQDYIDHFKEIFLRAVSDRARSGFPMGFEVSGGVDSSSVASMVKHLEETGRISRTDSRLYSCVYKAFPEADERSYVNQLAKRCIPWESSFLDGDRMWDLKGYGSDPGFPPDEPDIISSQRGTIDLAQQAKQDGCRVLLNGYGGDQLLQGSAYHNSYFLGDVLLKDLWREWPYFAEASEWNRGKLFFSGLLKPRVSKMLPEQFRLAFRASFSPEITGQKQPDWLAKKVPDNTRTMFSVYKTELQSSVFGALFGGYWQKGIAELDRFSGANHIERRYPFLDKHLFEFVFSLPVDLLFSKGFCKVILREAMAGILPEPIRTRLTYGTSDELTDYGWREKEKEKIRRLLDSPKTANIGWVSLGALQQSWDAYWKGKPVSTWELNAWLMTELWIREKVAFL